MQVPASSLSQPVSVWDWPIRLFHWLLAFAVTGLVLTGLKGGDAMQQHALLGYTVLGLLCPERFGLRDGSGHGIAVRDF
ncbi:MAG: hypothetical protein EBX67_06775 [Betaproteobacteria bacterium]|nr:hypothetical protein [Betaproteobacteria bacterium]